MTWAGLEAGDRIRSSEQCLSVCLSPFLLLSILPSPNPSLSWLRQSLPVYKPALTLDLLPLYN